MAPPAAVLPSQNASGACPVNDCPKKNAADPLSRRNLRAGANHTHSVAQPPPAHASDSSGAGGCSWGSWRLSLSVRMMVCKTPARPLAETRPQRSPPSRTTYG
jgi:hypothetical protein